MTHLPKLLFVLLIVALLMAAVGAIAAPNWIARSPALAMTVILAVVSAYVFSTGNSPRSKP